MENLSNKTNDNKIKKREKWIDYAKTFTCIMIVFFHVLIGLDRANIGINKKIFNYIIDFFSIFAMPLFMFLSGYLYKMNSDIESMKDYVIFIKRKLINIGIPYLIFYTIFNIVTSIFSNEINTQYEFWDMFIKPSNFFWFLYTLIGIFIIIPIIEKIFKKNCIKVLCITLLLNIIGKFFTINIFVIDTFFVYAFYFYLGVVIKEKFNKREMKLIEAIISIILYIFLTIIYFWGANYIKNYIVVNFIETIIAILGVFAASNIFRVMEDKIVDIKIWNLIGKYTFQIYILHVFFTSGMRILLFKIGLYNSCIHIIVGFLMGIICPIIASIIAEKSCYLNIFFFPEKTIKNIKLKYENKGKNNI